VRLIFYIITVVVTPPGIWIFPQLFADVGFVDSFIPFYEWDLPKKKKGKKAKSLEKGKGKEREKDSGTDQPRTAYIEEVDDSESSRPVSRNATVTDAVDEST